MVQTTRKMQSQETRILKWLKKGKTLTSIQALNQFHCFRLAARISDLREKGYNIETKPYKLDESKKIVALYKLIDNERTN
jgi:hypothetical protein